jgi:cytochrome c oxidase subunit 3
VSAEANAAPPVLDVASLVSHEFDHHAPIWWGNLLLILVETTMFGLLVASYFYLRFFFDTWPPPRTEWPPILDPLPYLVPGMVLVAVLAVSCVAMALGDRAARRYDAQGVVVWFLLGVALGVAALALRSYEFPATHFRWDSNAYGSIVWTLLGFHMMHMIAAILETLLVAIWVWIKGLDGRHACDATVIASYWYWMVGVWVPVYLVLYFAPRVL